MVKLVEMLEVSSSDEKERQDLSEKNDLESESEQSPSIPRTTKTQPKQPDSDSDSDSESESELESEQSPSITTTTKTQPKQPESESDEHSPVQLPPTMIIPYRKQKQEQVVVSHASPIKRTKSKGGKHIPSEPVNKGLPSRADSEEQDLKEKKSKNLAKQPESESDEDESEVDEDESEGDEDESEGDKDEHTKTLPIKKQNQVVGLVSRSSPTNGTKSKGGRHVASEPANNGLPSRADSRTLPGQAKQEEQDLKEKKRSKNLAKQPDSESDEDESEGDEDEDEHTKTLPIKKQKQVVEVVSRSSPKNGTKSKGGKHIPPEPATDGFSTPPPRQGKQGGQYLTEKKRKTPAKDSDSESEGDEDEDEDEHTKTLPIKKQKQVVGLVSRSSPKNGTKSKGGKHIPSEPATDGFSTPPPRQGKQGGQYLTEKKSKTLAKDSESEGDEDEDEISPPLLTKTQPKHSESESEGDDDEEEEKEDEHSPPTPTKTQPKHSESESEGDEEEEEEKEDEHSPPPPTKSTLPIRKQVVSHSSPNTTDYENKTKSINAKEDSDSDSEEEEGDEDSSSPPTIKTLAAVSQPPAIKKPAALSQPPAIKKPAAVSQPAAIKKPAAVSQPAAIRTPAVSSQPQHSAHVVFPSSKRLADPSGEGKNSKRAKKKGADFNDDDDDAKSLKNTVTKKKIKRVWSEDDETTLLKGFIDYRRNNIAVNMNSFYDEIKGSLHLDANKTQVTNKLSKLRMKYDEMKGKNGDGDGDDEGDTVYQLCKQIWGNLEMTEFVGASSVGGGGENMMNNLENQMVVNVSRLKEGAKKVEIEKKMKLLKLKEIELNLEKVQLLREMAAIENEEMNSY